MSNSLMYAPGAPIWPAVKRLAVLTTVSEDEKKTNAEWRFLTRRVLTLCQEVDRIATAAIRAASAAPTRESHLQVEAFRERRRNALDLIEKIRDDGHERPFRHLENLRRLVTGLECSRSYFISPRGMA